MGHGTGHRLDYAGLHTIPPPRPIHLAGESGSSTGLSGRWSSASRGQQTQSTDSRGSQPQATAAQATGNQHRLLGSRKADRGAGGGGGHSGLQRRALLGAERNKALRLRSFAWQGVRSHE